MPRAPNTRTIRVAGTQARALSSLETAGPVRFIVAGTGRLEIDELRAGRLTVRASGQGSVRIGVAVVSKRCDLHASGAAELCVERLELRDSAVYSCSESGAGSARVTLVET